MLAIFLICTFTHLFEIHEDSHANLIRYHLDFRLSSNRLKDDRSVYGSSSAQECFIPRSSRWVFYPTTIILGIIRQMPVTVKEKEGRADRQSRLFASTADTWSTRLPKVSSTLTDLSIGSSRTAFSFSSSEIFVFLWNLLEVHTVDRTFLSRP